MNASTILTRLLGNDDVQTLYALYGPLRSASSPACFIRCLRRCQIAEALVQAIGIHYVKNDPVVRKALAKNIKPYVLALGHFFEEYRSGLASHGNSALYQGYNFMLADKLLAIEPITTLSHGRYFSKRLTSNHHHFFHPYPDHRP